MHGRRSLLPLLLASSALGIRHSPAGRSELNQFMANVTDSLRNRCSGQARPRIVVFDVGSNDGGTSQWILSELRARIKGTSSCRPFIKLVAVEPQRRFHSGLERLVAQSDGGELVRFAAWTSNTTLHFKTMKNSQEAHLASGQEVGAGTAVPAIDLAELMNRIVRPSDEVLFKLDTEGAEYTLLPTLLARGALCLGAALHLWMEWHLHRLPAAKRLSALGLRLSLDHTLTAGCGGGARPLKSALHEEFQLLNYAKRVPGLQDEAIRHVNRDKPNSFAGSLPPPLGIEYNVSVRAYAPTAYTTFLNGKRR